MTVMPPARRPCGSCPYRVDAPSGLWAAEEYAKLPAYDAGTAEQPIELFLCHQQDGRVCAGWAGCHDMEESLAARLAVPLGQLQPDDLQVLRDYRTDVPLFPSGAAAAAHGLADVAHPGQRAARMAAKLRRRRCSGR